MPMPMISGIHTCRPHNTHHQSIIWQRAILRITGVNLNDITLFSVSFGFVNWTKSADPFFANRLLGPWGGTTTFFFFCLALVGAGRSIYTAGSGVMVVEPTCTYCSYMYRSPRSGLHFFKQSTDYGIVQLVWHCGVESMLRAVVIITLRLRLIGVKLDT